MTTEERLAKLEGAFTALTLGVRELANLEAERTVELALLVAIALENIAQQAGANINDLILALDAHRNRQAAAHPRADMTLVDAVLGRLRLPR